jgi:multiple antibiotic resistance protein
MMSFNDWIQYVLSLFVICSPLTAIPVLIALTPRASSQERKKLGLKIGLACGVILVITTWFGGAFLSFLQVKVASFQVTGGLILLLLGLSMLSSNNVKENKEMNEDSSAIVVVPMAIPLLAGPGAISTVIVQSTLNPSIMGKLSLSFAALTLGLIISVMLYFATKIERVLGIKGLNVATKIGGLILAALAVETMSKGVAGLLSCYQLG